MATFKYKAISKDGADVNGVIEAYDEFDAVDKIKQNCSLVTSITEVIEKEQKSNELFGPRKIKEKTLAILCSQFAIILNAGLPVVRAVELIAAQTADKNLRNILFKVAEDVASGHNLAQSFENKGQGLPTTFIETIRSGEESGTLDIAFEKLHKYYDKSAKVKSKVASAMAYPAFTCTVALVVIIVIMVFAVPSFTAAFADMGTALPLPTRMLIATSNFFSSYGIILAVIIVAIIIGLKVYSKTEKGRMAFGEFRLKLPLLGSVAIMKGASQFANTMSTMQTAGLPVIQAVKITARVMDNYYMGRQLLGITGGLEEGRHLGECLRTCSFFPEMLIEMTSVGEETGSLESTLDVIGAYYDNEVEQKTARALSLLEPIIICVLAVFVVMILLSVYLPMFTMYGGI